jgi:hypothetical protein
MSISRMSRGDDRRHLCKWSCGKGSEGSNQDNPDRFHCRVRAHRGWTRRQSEPTGRQPGLSILDVELGPKRLDLPHELIPKATNVTALVNPTDRARATAISENMRAAARTIGLQLQVLNASTDSDIDTVFGNLAQQQTSALVIGGDPFFNSRAEHLGALTVRHAVPAIYQLRAFAAGAAWLATGLILPIRIGKWAFTPAASSMGRGRPTCQSSRPRRSS